MTDYKFTRCPGCTTVFRITSTQLALREGQVRCGHCRAVFDANDHLVTVYEPVSVVRSLEDAFVEEAPVEEAPAEAAPAEAAPAEEAPPEEAPPEAAPAEAAPAEAAPAEEAPAEEAPAEEAPAEEAPAEEAPAEPALAEAAPAEEPPVDQAGAEQGAAEPDASAAAAIVPVPEAPERYQWKPRKSLRETPKALYAVAIVVLLCALAAQAILEYRDMLAAHAPFTRPILEAACRPLGCAIGPLRDAAALSIEASDLQADPAHRGLLQLSATIRNRASYAIAFPHLELTLTDASDQPVVRRAFPPGDYIGGTANAASGIPANGEKLVKLFIDASATAQAGYRLYLFYP